MWVGAAAVGTVLAGAARDTGGEGTGMDGAAALIAMDGGAAIARATADGGVIHWQGLSPGRLPPGHTTVTAIRILATVTATRIPAMVITTLTTGTGVDPQSHWGTRAPKAIMTRSKPSGMGRKQTAVTRERIARAMKAHCAAHPEASKAASKRLKGVHAAARAFLKQKTAKR